jgi:hypothetical protein
MRDEVPDPLITKVPEAKVEVMADHRAQAPPSPSSLIPSPVGIFACASAGNGSKALNALGPPASREIGPARWDTREESSPITPSLFRFRSDPLARLELKRSESEGPSARKRVAIRGGSNASRFRRPQQQTAQGALRQTHHLLFLKLQSKRVLLSLLCAVGDPVGERGAMPHVFTPPSAPASSARPRRSSASATPAASPSPPARRPPARSAPSPNCAA